MNTQPNLLLIPDFYPQATELFALLLTTISWDKSMQARQTASFGKAYNYSQMFYPDSAIPKFLMPVQHALFDQLHIQFNNCLLNYYETGEHTMGFHADDTSALMPHTGVAIVSLGSERQITYRSKIDPSIQIHYALASGSLLYMDDQVQDAWVHAIKRQKHVGARISLTWRVFR
ncbi:alpha-ketoglutarate-dependent dioxygenase AlkB [Thiolinea disciformis]|uniref:alpha-ketoglutarate-dependent dioxygenase AlkB n=1 Tax=Thiolinea disciformis TaxID=125614 RepID=UPI00035C0B7E|nr:alpha-ketoglutarate-dependent dioxygenase AlkB [Thiolinea disciformis]